MRQRRLALSAKRPFIRASRGLAAAAAAVILLQATPAFAESGVIAGASADAGAKAEAIKLQARAARRSAARRALVTAIARALPGADARAPRGCARLSWRRR